jgi:uncharacterized protein with PIN domain
MAYSAVFTFYGNLTDFLPKKYKGTIPHLFTGTPSVKDAIETMGVPHVEVDVIAVNDNSVDFTYLLSPGDRIAVFAKHHQHMAANIIHLLPPFPAQPAFILDVHLGKLARLLRMTGFDALYQTDFADAQIAEIAAAEKRIVLTRDIALLKRKIIPWGYWPRSRQPEKQLVEVLVYFNLLNTLKPFIRCMNCNELIRKIDKTEISQKLEPHTRLYYDEFYHCMGCHKIYWKGSHYQKMEDYILLLRSILLPGKNK